MHIRIRTKTNPHTNVHMWIYENIMLLVHSPLSISFAPFLSLSPFISFIYPFNNALSLSSSLCFDRNWIENLAKAETKHIILRLVLAHRLSSIKYKSTKQYSTEKTHRNLFDSVNIWNSFCSLTIPSTTKMKYEYVHELCYNQYIHICMLMPMLIQQYINIYIDMELYCNLIHAPISSNWERRRWWNETERERISDRR